MLLGQVRHGPEASRPDAHEEEDGQDGHRPGGRHVARPQKVPATAVRRRQKVVLDDGHDKEPHHDLATHQRPVKGRDVARLAPVGLGQPEEEHTADSPQEDRDGHGDAGDDARGRGDQGHAVGVLKVRRVRAPVPERGDVDLLGALDGAGAEHPRPHGVAALGQEVLREEEEAAGRADGVQRGGGVLQARDDGRRRGEGDHAEHEEGGAVEEEGEGDGDEELASAEEDPPED